MRTITNMYISKYAYLSRDKNLRSQASWVSENLCTYGYLWLQSFCSLKIAVAKCKTYNIVTPMEFHL